MADRDLSWNSSSCPWGEADPTTLISCEAQYCQWARQPLNTYSSIVYLLLAVLLIVHYRKNGSRFFLVFTGFAIALGVSSALAHASQLVILGFLDFGSQFLMFSFLAAINARVLFRLSLRAEILLWFWLSAFAVTALIAVKNVGVWLFPLYFTIVALLEAILVSKSPAQEYKSLKTGLIVFGLGAIAFMLDLAHATCDPTNHYFQFHALWHVLTAISMYFVAIHFSQRSRSQ